MKKLYLLSIILILLPAFISAQEQDAKSRFFAGITAEEIEGDLDKAINIYQDILNRDDVDRQLAARCLYHIGVCHDKKESGQAMEYFTSLLEKYPDQADLADLARNRIAKLKDANTFIDPRDGHKYRYVQIGDQTWMAENLAYMPHVNPSKNQELGIWVYDYEGYDVAEAKTTENYQKYGCLYDWTTAMDIDPKYLKEAWTGDPENHQGLCPAGWRMPSEKDWTELEKLLGLTDEQIEETNSPWNMGTRNTCGGLKLKSPNGWISGGNGNNDLGLSIIPGGVRRFKLEGANDYFDEIGEWAYFWTSYSLYNDSLWGNTRKNSFTRSTSRSIKSLNNGTASDIVSRMPLERTLGQSIRCIKSSNPKLSDKKESYLEKAQLLAEQKKAIDPNYISVLPELIHIIPRNDSLEQPRVLSLIAGDKLVVWSIKDSLITAYDLNNYREIWKTKDYVKTNRGKGFIARNNELLFNNGKQIVSIDVDTGNKLKSVDCVGGQLVTLLKSNSALVRSGRRASIIHKINLETGEELWSYNAGDSISINDPESDKVYIYFGFFPWKSENIDDSYRKKFVAIDIESGKEVWSFNGKGRIAYQKPLVVGNDVIFMNSMDQYVYSLNKLTGDINWKYYIDHIGSSNFIKIGNQIFFSDNEWFWGTSTFYAIDLEGTQVWKKNLPENMATLDIVHSESDKVFLPVTDSDETFLMVISTDKDSKNWMMKLPKTLLANHLFTDDKIIAPTLQGIYIYKYPEFE